ncbi:MAG TPA: cytochrome c biogenesis protein CcsA [Perlabentimonas sp.]|nr:cytochrome c biogenesis protein CcsA [Perlabentimonas sp.]
MPKFTKLLASPVLMAILIIAFTVSSAIATFIENDFGTLAARTLIYNAWWFEFIMLLLCANFIASIFHRKLFTSGKLAIMLFHLGFVVIIIGAGITRYIGQEGMLHVREGEVATTFKSSESYFRVTHGKSELLEKKVDFTPVSSNRFKKTVKVNGNPVRLRLTSYIPNAYEAVVEHSNGYPVVNLVILDSVGSQQVYVRPGKTIPIGINGVGFNDKKLSRDIELSLSDSGIVARSVFPVTSQQMMGDASTVIEPQQWFKLSPQTFYSTDYVRFAYRAHWPKGKVVMLPSKESEFDGVDVLAFSVDFNAKSTEVFVPVTKSELIPVTHQINGTNLVFTYGPKNIDLPFKIKLNNFELERYPGSDSPSSFISNVEVLDKDDNPIKPFSIYMNNILAYKGYRFYQSSYDPDERGTYLSVNKDFWGTAVTYFGYLLLIVGIMWSLFAPASRFRKLINKPVVPILATLILLTSSGVFAQQLPVPTKAHAKEFSELLMQDKGGRIKPIGTLAGEVLRKLNRSTRFQGYTPEQVFLAISAFPDYWQGAPIIKVGNEDLRGLLGVQGEMVPFVDFFNHQAGSTYKLGNLVQEAFAVKPSQRTALQKDIIKIDEKVNVLYMVFSGQMACTFPIPNHPNNQWLSMVDATETADSVLVQPHANLYARYILSVREAAKSGRWETASDLLDSLKISQGKYGAEVIPSHRRISAETLSNRLLPFERLIPIYGITGLMLLILVFVGLFYKTKIFNKLYKVLTVALVLGFIFHTIAIGLRWYIAQRAPLSNGFESMVYVAWAAMLAGFIFSKRSRVVLPATALLSTLTLFVAHLSWMDPEITNLVPVLKSYWLTIHVAVITASYGFLGLGAILGLFNLGLMVLKNRRNSNEIDAQISSITTINELTLTLGLYLLTIGSFLGAVWANESWGRYWGWDPKETWALITILVYAFLLHMRLIPSLKTAFSFNFGSVIGLGSVLMTYFGVNYYLSGLHSYAGGDPVPIPAWFYFVIGALLLISWLAWYNNKKIDREAGK